MSDMTITEFGENFRFDGTLETENTVKDAGGHMYDVHVIVRPRASNGNAAGNPNDVISAMLFGLTGGGQAEEIIASVTGS